MESVLELLNRVFPEFGTARGERIKIRNKCGKNLKALERGDDVQLLDTQGTQIEYLHYWTETTCVDIDHLIQDWGSVSRHGFYSISSSVDTSELESKLETAIWKIRLKNAVSWVLQVTFIVFVVGVIGASMFLGIVGVDSVVSGIQEFL